MNQKKSHEIDCGTALEWIHLSLDNQLPPVDQDKLEAHLQGCKNCTAAYQELHLIEKVHRELDQRQQTVAPDYFEALPARVLARIEAAEQPASRSTWVPRARSAPRRSPGWLQQVLFGRGKYVLAFASMALLLFFLTRQLRQGLFHTSSGERQAAAPTRSIGSQQPAQSPQKAAPEQRDLGKVRKENAPDQTTALARAPEQFTKPSAAPALPASPASVEEESKHATVLVLDAHEQEEASTAPLPHEASASSSGAVLHDTISGALQFISNRGYAAEALQVQQNAAGAGAAVLSSEKTHAPAGMTSKKMALKPSYTATPATARAHDFQQTIAQAQQASSEAARREIWQEFIKAGSDSTHAAFAITEIARSYGTEIDSSSSQTLLEEALQFYDGTQPQLQVKMGKTGFEHERRRIAGLLSWKKEHP